MLIRFDPLRELDRFAQQWPGLAGREPVMPIDAYRRGDAFVLQFDLPGASPESVDVTVEQNVLTVSAQRRPDREPGDEVLVSERQHGRFTRQLMLGEALDSDQIAARFDRGVLTVTIPVAEQAKPRKVQVTAGTERAGAVEVTTGAEQRELAGSTA